MNGRPKFGFINELRNYKRINSSTPAHLQRDFFSEGQKLLPRSENQKLRKTKKNQLVSSIRLAEPKRYPDPYQGVFYRPKTASVLRAESLQKTRNIGFY